MAKVGAGKSGFSFSTEEGKKRHFRKKADLTTDYRCDDA
jgi:hypothetical protein